MKNKYNTCSNTYVITVDLKNPLILSMDISLAQKADSVLFMIEAHELHYKR